ncbi:DNA polymerase delta catalytic subunit [Hamiltosporidium tvaerminnensis]|nr:DNA polymerase delta catalytic subunit [Hamiltosporidium tvaerminnensis]
MTKKTDTDLIFLSTHIDNPPISPNTIKISGITLQGTPLTLHVTDFNPYFYIRPPNPEPKNFISLLSSALTKKMNEKSKSVLLRIEKVYKKSFLYYSPTPVLFYQLFFTNTLLFSQLTKILESGIYIDDVSYTFQVFESNIPLPIRFMIDKELTGMSYIKVTKYKKIKNKNSNQNNSNNETNIDSGCTTTNTNPTNTDKNISNITKNNTDIPNTSHYIEYITSHTNISHIDSITTLPPLKILSFDIECISKTSSFPSAKIDPVIQIGNIISVDGLISKHIFALDSCADIPNATVHSFTTETELLKEWIIFLIKTDPDILLGYNITNFDFPYLVERSETLKIKEFKFIGRDSSSIRINTNNNTTTVHIQGRMIFDLYVIIKKEYNLRSYTLNSVSEYFLGNTKEDLPYNCMYSLQMGDKETRRRIALYCLKDCLLPLNIFDKLNILINCIEMCRVVGVPIEYLNRGQAIRVFAMICRKAKFMGYVVPVVENTEGEKYEGGYVMDPVKGFYEDCVAVMDFSSLYPSIMISKNLCYSTLVRKKDFKEICGNKNGEFEKESVSYEDSIGESELEGMDEEYDKGLDEGVCDKDIDVGVNDRSNDNYHPLNTSTDKQQGVNNNKDKQHPFNNTPNNYHPFNTNDLCLTPTNNLFVKKDILEGLLPIILKELLEERKKAKKSLEIEKNEQTKASLNARQLALKICANSVYGFTGASKGFLPCMEISQSVTSFGREMINFTRKLIEEKYDVKVIYGDTDSVMVRFKKISVSQIFQTSRDICEYVTQRFDKPVRLEFEKVYCPFLLINKKRYVGLICKRGSEMEEKGKESNDSKDNIECRESNSKDNSKDTKKINLERHKDNDIRDNLDKEKELNKDNNNDIRDTNNNTLIPYKIDSKGIETVRRDNCKLVRNVMESCLYKILWEKDLEGTKEFIKKVITDLYMNKVDISQLVISKSLTKSKENYLSKAAHVELAEKMKKRGEVYGLGDRIPYVIIKGSKGMAAYERAEDPVFVLENNIPLDVEYYIENQLSKPIHRLFEPIMDNVSVLLKGEHTRSRMGVSSKFKGSMNVFLINQIKCLGCKSKGKILCDLCSKEYSKYYLGCLKKVEESKKVYCKCWVECQRCIGSVMGEVICANRDCDIFYLRSMAKKELIEETEKLEILKKFEW